MRSRRPARAAHAWTLGLCLFVVSEARAAPPDPSPEPPRQTVILIADRRTDPIMARIYAELAALGFTVSVVRGGADSPARDAGTAASIRVTEVPGGVEVSITKGATGKAVQHAMLGDDPATIAIRAVELLRASLLEVRSPHPPRGEIETDPEGRATVDAERPPPAKPAPAAARPRPDGSSHAPPSRASMGVATRRAPTTFGVGAAPAILWSAGGLAASPMLDLSAYAMIWPRVGISTFVLIPLAGASNEGKEGTRHVRVALASVGVRVPLGPAGAAWLPSLGAGLSGVWLHVEGEGRAPDYVGTSRDAFAIAPYLRAGLSFAPIPRLRIAEHLLAGIAVPRIVIDAAGRATESWGRPFLGASLGLEVALP